MKRLCLIIIALALGAAVITGCASSEDAISDGSVKSSADSMADICSVNGFSSENFNIETDDQVFFSDNHEIAACSEGYYYFSGELLYFFDKNSKQAVPLCNNPDCKHTADYADCNAYFASEEFYTYLGIYYYNSNLYILGNGGKENSKSLYLYKISKDGTAREQVRCLADFGSDIGSMQIRFTQHMGKGYLSYGGENKAELFCFEIDNKKQDLVKIDEISGTGAEIYRLQGCDGGISYEYGRFTDESLEKFEGGIKIYMDGAIANAVAGAVKPYVITMGNVYYEANDGIKITSLKTGEARNFKGETKSNSIKYDGSYFYVYDVMADNNQTVYVYDVRENYVCEFNVPQSDVCNLLFGDSDLFFCRCTNFDSGDESMYYFEKIQLKNGKIDWTKLY